VREEDAAAERMIRLEEIVREEDAAAERMATDAAAFARRTRLLLWSLPAAAFVLGLALAWMRPWPAPAAPVAGTASLPPVALAGSAVPAQPVPPATAPAPPATVAYTVQPGDSLWSIAGRKYGNASLWREIAAANPGANPDRLVPGQSVRLPPITIRPQ
jgi:LysM repeat protein